MLSRKDFLKLDTDRPVLSRRTRSFIPLNHNVSEEGSIDETSRIEAIIEYSNLVCD